MFAPAGTFDADSSHYIGAEVNTTNGEFDSSHDSQIRLDKFMTINPATGLQMLEDSGIDIQGSPYGFDIHDHIHTPIFESDSATFSHDCSPTFEYDTHLFDCGVTFDSFHSIDYGSTFD